MLRTLLFLIATTAAAHPLSMSTSELQIDPSSSLLRVRIPGYEAVHIGNPARDVGRSFALIIDNRRFTPVTTLCRRPAGDALFCDLTFEAPQSANTIAVECTLPKVIVNTHVHVLRAQRGDESARAIFDESRSTFTLQFTPDRQRQSLRQLLQASFSWTWFLPALALGFAARSRREFLVLAAVFLVSLFGAAFSIQPDRMLFPRRFVEVAICAASAYAAVEAVFLTRTWVKAIAIAVPSILISFLLSAFCETRWLCGALSVVIAIPSLAIAGIVAIAAGFLNRRTIIGWALALLCLAMGSVILLRTAG